MILHSYEGGDPDRARRSLTVAVLVTAALATSIDGIAVGVTLALVRANILLLLALIGAVTFLVACCGDSLGRVAGRVFGRWAEFIGGIGLM
jgi:putative Mn2+ efflux pump MntP